MAIVEAPGAGVVVKPLEVVAQLLEGPAQARRLLRIEPRAVGTAAVVVGPLHTVGPSWCKPAAALVKVLEQLTIFVWHWQIPARDGGR